MISISDACTKVFIKSGIKKFKGIFLMCDSKDNLYYVFSENGFSDDFTNNGAGLHILSIKTGVYEKMTKEKYNNDFKENFFILAETEIPYDFAYRNENSQIKFN